MDMSDEVLMAYVDGELSSEKRHLLETAVRADPALAARLLAHQSLRDEVGGTFALVADDPVPERLLRTVLAGSAQPSNVALFRPKPKLAVPTWLWASGGALAAGLALGIFVSPTLSPPPGAALIGPDMTARGALQQALNHQLASEPGSHPVKIGVTFRASDGPLCRTFEARTVAGLACHRANADWAVKMAVPAHAVEVGAYQTAASRLPQPVAELAQSLEAGVPLGAEDEAKARTQGWR